jgi:hypothetical protein
MSLSGAIDPVGPGDVYQIDSTTADIYLVNSLSAKIPIGRPTLYLVIDVWSGMIVGFNLTLRRIEIFRTAGKPKKKKHQIFSHPEFLNPLSPTIPYSRTAMSKIKSKKRIQQDMLPQAPHASSTRKGISVSVGSAYRIIFVDLRRSFPMGMFYPGGFKTDLKVHYDPRLMDQVIVEHPNSNEMIVCHLSRQCAALYTGLSWVEGAARQAKFRLAIRLHAPKEFKLFPERHAAKAAIFQQALKS